MELWWKELTRTVVAITLAVVGLLVLLTINTIGGICSEAGIIGECWLTAGFISVILWLGIKNFIDKNIN